MMNFHELELRPRCGQPMFFLDEFGVIGDSTSEKMGHFETGHVHL